MRKLNVDSLSKQEKIDIYKQCFDLFVNNEQSYKPIYYINGYEIDRRNFLIFKQAYYEELATYNEKKQYDQMLVKRRNKRYERVQTRYKEAFTAYINKTDSDDFYERLSLKSSVSLDTAKKYPELYFEKYATDEEKRMYIEVKNTKEETKEVIKEKNVREKLKYMFDLCINSNFDEAKIETLTERYSISPKTIKNYVLKYCEMYATEEELVSYNKARQNLLEKRKVISIPTSTENNARYVNIFNQLLICQNVKQAMYYLLKEKVDITYLRTSLNPYTISFPETNTKKLEIIIDYYTKYLEYKKNNDLKIEQARKINEIENKIKIVNIQKSKLKIQKAKKIITNLINVIKDYNASNYKSSISFCAKKNITIELFNKALEVVKKYNKTIYNQYIQKEKLQNQKANPEATLQIKQILLKIEEKDFEIIDYYKITNMDFDELLELSNRVCNTDEIKIIQDFVDKNKPKQGFDVNKILNKEFIMVDYGKTIKITGEVTQKIIDYLNKFNIPINDKTYISALRREVYVESKKQMRKIA